MKSVIAEGADENLASSIKSVSEAKAKALDAARRSAKASAKAEDAAREAKKLGAKIETNGNSSKKDPEGSEKG